MQLAQQKVGTHSFSSSFFCPQRLRDGSRDTSVLASLLPTEAAGWRQGRTPGQVTVANPHMRGEEPELGKSQVADEEVRGTDGHRAGHPELSLCEVCL